MSEQETAGRWGRWQTAFVVAVALLIGALFFTRFVAAGFVLGRLAPAAAAAILTALAAIACGAWTISLATRLVSRITGPPTDRVRPIAEVSIELLAGASVLGSVLAVIGLLHRLHGAVVIPLVLVAATAGVLMRWRSIAAIPSAVAAARPLLLLVPILFAFASATTPVNTPDELVYKLAAPREYLRAGAMIELPLKSHTYIPSAIAMADVPPLLMSGGIAARLFHFLLYLATLAILHRLGSRIAAGAGIWIAAIVAWTPALALIAGWAWSDWAMIGLVLASLLRWHEYLDTEDPAELASAAVLLGAALAAQYSGLPWLVVFLPLAIWRVWRKPTAIRPLAAAALVVSAVGLLFYVRNAVWTGSPLAPFFLDNSPAIANYRSGGSGWSELIRGVDIFDPGIIDDSLGIVLPVMVLIAPLALLRRTRLVVDLLVLGIAQLAILIPLAPTSRLTTLAFVPLAVAGGATAAGIWASAGRWTRRLLGGLAAAALFAQILLVAWVYVTSWRFLPYLVGAESEVAYLTRTRGFMRPYEWIATHTPADATILLLGENRTFYLDRRSLAAGNLDGPRMAAWLGRSSTPDALARELRGEGVTHVLVHKPWYRVETPGAPPPRMLEKEYLLTLPATTDATLRACLTTHAIAVYADREYTVFALKPAPETSK